MLAIPNQIRDGGFVGAPVSFEWNEEISSGFAFDRELNVRLATAFNEANYRTNIALAVAVFEWFVRRFDGILDLTDAYWRLEAAWACTINPAYLNDGRFEQYEYGESVPPPSDDVLTVGIARIWKPLRTFMTAEINLAAQCVNLTLLTRHVMPDPRAFDSWLEATLRKCAAAYPREVESYDFKADFYDFRAERIVPRAFFFDPEFESSDESASAALQAFLDSLNPEENPYLNNAEQMAAEGYTRTPYQLLDLRKG